MPQHAAPPMQGVSRIMYKRSSENSGALYYISLILLTFCFALMPLLTAAIMYCLYRRLSHLIQ
jgi:hypothetical protein